MLKTSGTAFAAASTIALVAMPAIAKSKDHITRQENQLLAAGFEARPANTPERQTMLASLPKEKFFRRVNGDNVAYLYADPVHCNCLYVGTQQAYGTYRATMQQAQIARDQLNAADAYQDSNWNWGPWGPWDGPWAGFGFWPNRGW
ncbi:hypothetical protein [Novosphingobium lindaniclasticum]|uniref:Uncharacterized protein n=1 Tax=Novosphingobium lindaniclasticum LE124 TaxID=1096930 RepID=T0H636_9SPHN|nr:hypothetical protein [Novosphingobium lindaniclasticum]EQB07598.1 hypothetical protein L284_22330 [Novosphingobium lindaniclasticum LE124]